MVQRRPRSGQPAAAPRRVHRRAAGELESAVLTALWGADAPLTPTGLQAALGDDLAYNTVHTILTRLQDKGLVVRVTHQGRPAYTPAKDAAELAAERMRGALQAGGDRAEILQHFVTSLTRDEEQALRAALEQTQQ